jgi:peptidoglycan/xylan/chitin deacetylase (PgdA/CDA1 family)
MTPAQRIKYAIKLVVSHVLYYTGVLSLWQTTVLRRKAVVLMYHRVLTADERRRAGSHPGLIVDRDTFAMHAAVLKRRFTPLSPAAFADRLSRHEPFPDSSCLITFDDGWDDNRVNALPVLRAHDLPALIFLPVNYIGTQRPFRREALSQLLARAVLAVRESPSRRGAFASLLQPAGLAGVLDVADADPLEAAVRATGDTALSPVMSAVVPPLAAELGVSLESISAGDRFMDWDQVAALSEAGIAFGGHGAEHVLLDRVPLDEARRDIDDCKRTMDARLGASTVTFSYPNGNWNRDIADAVAQAGFPIAFTTASGFVNCDDPPLTIRRINIHEGATSTAPMFLATLVGLF